MQIKELDPAKQYAVLLESDWVTQEDCEALSSQLKQRGINAVVIAGASVQGGERYWGIYSQAFKRWMQKLDGTLYVYPSAAIAQAHADGYKRDFGKEDWAAREFIEGHSLKAMAAG